MLFNELNHGKYEINVMDKCLHIKQAGTTDCQWYIIYRDELFTAVEIKQCGKEDILDDFTCLIDAIKHAEKTIS